MITTPLESILYKRKQLSQEVKKQMEIKGCSVTTLAAFSGVHPNVVKAIINEKNTTTNSMFRVCFMLDIQTEFFGM